VYAAAPEAVYAILTHIVDAVSHTRLTSNILVMMLLSGAASFLNVAAHVPLQKPPALRRRSGQTQAPKDPLSRDCSLATNGSSVAHRLTGLGDICVVSGKRKRRSLS